MYIVEPWNGKLLLKRKQMETKSTQSIAGFAFPEDTTPGNESGEFFEVLDKAADCDTSIKCGDLVSAEVVTPLGKINGEILYVCHPKSVVARLQEKK